MYHYSTTAKEMSGQQEPLQREKCYTESVLAVIVLVWRNYADKTGSSLFVEETHGRVELMLTNSKRFDVEEGDVGIKLALGMATHVGMDIVEGRLQLWISYSMT